MGLLACPDCGRQVSDAAPSCPGCGRPTDARAAYLRPGPAGPQAKPRWYHHPVVIALLLVLFFPLGAVLLWTAPNARLTTKLGATLLFAFLWLAIIRGGHAGNAGQATPAPQAAMAAPTRAYVLPAEIALAASAQRTRSGEIVIVGTTNLPDGTKLGAELAGGQDYDIHVAEGAFRSTGFTDHGRPLPAGSRKVRILAYFNEAWQSPEVLSAVGKGGGRLNGPFIQLEDPGVVDSAKILDAKLTVQLPPISAEGAALDLVKRAVLTVDGKRSATDVQTNVALFMKAPGLQPAKGWTVSGEGGSKYLISYSFVDGEQGEQSATWEANTATKSVRYVNEAAKNFSWSPAE